MKNNHIPLSVYSWAVKVLFVLRECGASTFSELVMRVACLDLIQGPKQETPSLKSLMPLSNVYNSCYLALKWLFQRDYIYFSSRAVRLGYQTIAFFQFSNETENSDFDELTKKCKIIAEINDCWGFYQKYLDQNIGRVTEDFYGAANC